jgi:hypothetical protein
LVEGVGSRARGINANQVFGWRRLYLAGRLGQRKPAIKLLLVRVSESLPAPLPMEWSADFQKPQPGSLRGVALGRENYLFAGSDAGAERAAAICSLDGRKDRSGQEKKTLQRELLPEPRKT